MSSVLVLAGSVRESFYRRTRKLPLIFQRSNTQPIKMPNYLDHGGKQAIWFLTLRKRRKSLKQKRREENAKLLLSWRQELKLRVFKKINSLKAVSGVKMQLGNDSL